MNDRRPDGSPHLTGGISLKSVLRAGAVGGRVAVHLLTGGAAEVALVTRGAHLEAIPRAPHDPHRRQEMKARPATATDVLHAAAT